MQTRKHNSKYANLKETNRSKYNSEDTSRTIYIVKYNSENTHRDNTNRKIGTYQSETNKGQIQLGKKTTRNIQNKFRTYSSENTRRKQYTSENTSRKNKKRKIQIGEYVSTSISRTIQFGQIKFGKHTSEIQVEKYQ